MTQTSKAVQIQNVAAKILQGKEEPTVALSTYLPARDGMAIAKFSVVFHRNQSEESTANAISKLFDNKVRVVPGTMKFEHSPHASVSSVSARVQAVRPVKVVEQDAQGAINGFISISKNLFMSKADRTSWGLQKSGDKTLLVRQGNLESDSALNEILEALVSTSSGSRPFRERNQLIDAVHSLASSLEQGTLITYVQPSTKQHKLAFALSAPQKDDTVQVIPFIGPVETVSTSHITDAFDASGYAQDLNLPQVTSESAVSAKTINEIIAYYRRVFGMNEEFFRKWEAAIRGLANV